jgi:cardiolipin synthase
MALIPLFVSLLFYQKFLPALATFIVAGVTDGLDGLLARRFHQQSPLGRILDPIADKMMLVTSFIVLSMKGVFPTPIPKHLPIPFWVTITVLSRDVFILVGAAAINMVTIFVPFNLHSGKISTVVQIAAVATVMLAAQLRTGTAITSQPSMWQYSAFTLFSGIHYVFLFPASSIRPGATPAPLVDNVTLRYYSNRVVNRLFTRCR